MTNETTASQPKSIGDDAQFANLMGAYIDARQRKTGTSDVSAEFDALAAYIDSRAPAAQASATIQAAPDDLAAKIRAIAEKWNRTAISEGFAGNEVSCELLAVLGDFDDAATIQEQVMVAEPVGAAKPYSCETGQIDEELADFLGEHTRLNQDGIDTHAMNMTLALNYAAITPTPDEEIARWREQGYLPDAAPMVADPAGAYQALLDVRHAIQFSHDSLGGIDKMPVMMHHDGTVVEFIDAVLSGAATVKAVPSKALDAARYRWLRDQNIFQEVGSISPYAVRGQSMEMLDGPELDKAIDDAKNFAAPLADRTGGGE